MGCWNPSIEKMPRKDLREVQYRLAKALISRIYETSEFYRRRMKEQGVRPDDIRTLEDIRKLPFMYKRDLRDNYPDGLFCTPRDELVRYHVSSGTTGKPTVVGYTRHDIENWSESLARAFSSCGLGRGDVLQVSYGYGLFTGGLGVHYGAERVGATVLPTSVGNTERQIELMQDLHTTAIACTPSYLLHIGEVAEKMGVSIRDDTDLRIGILGAEPWSEQMRDRIQDWLGIRAYDIYGTSELSGPMFTECSEQQGIHIWGDLALVEIVDPETGEVLSPGERGELVITILQKEAFPVIRYRVGDVTVMDEDPCACGRTHPRIRRIQGRVDDMLIVRGINVFPSQVEHALLEIPEVGRHFQIVVDRKGALDTMLVRVEVSEEAFSDKITDLMMIRKMVEHRLKSSLNVGVAVELVEPGSLPRFEGKAKKVVDRRSI
ncbi:MAG TPA: phenylacetate--CoA ligase [Candidatus Methanoculleus thermohydrogenotrophicum]|jgi:phenylacetate-CoA ligase|nr:phenylacetate--CoA ligase [Candidatus Methanoculleus thermohydrogenotrophicum]HPZ37650.1 phenylacetate--CoA ligase [Candidatus Methanoculleus thermohydrogenotrophicum]HQE09631.1 phenylacetate--CoA ligase [Bacillota bacterium]HQE09675.1 phenylacetate--CoA ligase [Bacillota bacterium]